MFVEFFAHLINLDLAWIAELFLNNLFWIFAIFTASYFIFNKKHTVLGLGVIFFIVLGWQDFTKLIGWLYLAPAFLAIYYLIELAWLTGFEHTKGLKKYFVLGEELLFISSLIIFNVFLR